MWCWGSVGEAQSALHHIYLITLPFMYNELGSLSSTDTPAGYSNKLSNNWEIVSVQRTKWEESLFLPFHFPSSPTCFLFLPFPQPPYDKKRTLQRIRFVPHRKPRTSVWVGVYLVPALHVHGEKPASLPSTQTCWIQDQLVLPYDTLRSIQGPKQCPTL